MSEYKLEFTLKQHTPLIHFLHDQPGASLRATEFKPALDRYLIEKLTGQKDFKVATAAFETHPQYRFWLVGKGNKEQPALDYQLKIQADSEIYPIETYNDQNHRYQNFPAFFANLAKEGTPEAKHFSFCRRPVGVVFRSMDEELLTKIKQYLPGFLANNNFGSRKTKGFGSFSLEGQKAPVCSFFLELNCGRVNDMVTEWKRLFQKIDFFHRTLRSGFNNGRGGYIKSPLFLFCKEELDIQWDKKSVKQYFFSTALSNQSGRHGSSDLLVYGSPKKSPKGNFYLIRDLLGLATESDWRSPEYNNTKIQKAHSGNLIDRMPSPITYKPFALGDGRYLVNILLNPVSPAVLGQTFSITSTRHSGMGSLSLDFPPPGFFSLHSYFQFICNEEFDIRDLIGSKDRDTDLIVELFDQLKKNFQNKNQE